MIIWVIRSWIAQSYQIILDGQTNTMKMIALCAACTSLVFLFVWEQVQATRLGYKVSRRRAELRQRQDRTAYLRIELARLRAPARLAEEAQRRLQMAPAEPESLVFLGSEVPRLTLTASLTRPDVRGSSPTGGSIKQWAATDGRMAALIPDP